MSEATVSPGMKVAAAVGVAVLAFFLGRAFPSSSADSAKMLDLAEKNHAEIEGVKESLRHLTFEMRVAGKIDPADPTPKVSPTGNDGKLARLLVTNSAKEKQTLAEERLGIAQKHSKLTADNVHVIAADLQAMNAILTSPEHLDAALLDRVEKERDRLLDLLKTQIPPLVKAIDDHAIKERESKEALGIWAKSGALLGYYPASNIPKEAEAIQKIVTEHETVRTRLALLQKQRYNQWACENIKKAWLDFADPMITSTQAKLETCKRFLGPIETSHLEPISMELYRDFLDAIKKKASSEDYQALATHLANSVRVLPGEKESSK